MSHHGRPPSDRSGQWRNIGAALRLRQWWYFALLPLARVRLPLDGLATAAAAASVGVAALLLAFAYGLNAVYDSPTDRDQRKNPLAGHGIPPWTHAVLAGCAAGAWTAAAVQSPLSLAAAAVSSGAAWAYSAGPRWKARVGLGTVLNVFIFTPLLWVGQDRALVPPTLAVEALVLTILVLQNQLLHELADLDEDSGASTHTTAAWLGPARSHGAVIGLGLVGAIGVLCLQAGETALPGGLAALAAGVPLAAACCVWLPGSAPRRRRAHRWTAFLGGGGLYVGGLLLAAWPW